MPEVTPDQSQVVRTKIRRASLILMASILISRILGFFREWALAYMLGASETTDVYYASFTIPDFLNYLMAAGAISLSFIPLYVGIDTHQGRAKSEMFFRSVLTCFGGSLFLLVVLAEIFAPQLAYWIAPGFGDEQLALLTILLRIILPAQLFFYFGSVATAVQHSQNQFWVPALAPIFYNLGIILGGVLLHPWLGVMGFSVGVLGGSLLGHALLPIFGLKRLQIKFLPNLSFKEMPWEDLKKYFWLSVPLALGFSFVVTEEWISKYFASHLEPKSISWLSYARTSMRIPVAFLGQAMGVASFPFLAKLWAEGNQKLFLGTLFQEFAKLWAFVPAASLLMYVHALPICHFLFGGGKLSGSDLEATAQALRFFSLGILGWTGQIMISRCFYAWKMTWLPSLLGLLTSALAFPLYSWISERMGFKGLALAGSLGILFYFALLLGFLIFQLRKMDTGKSVKTLLTFVGAWCLVLVAIGFTSTGIQSLGIYQQTQLSALMELAVTGMVHGALL